MTEEPDITWACAGPRPAVPPTVRSADDPLPAALEAMLIVTDTGLTSAALAAAVGRTEADVRRALVALAELYDTAQRGMRLRETGSGWRWCAAPEHAEVVRRALTEQRPARLSQAALETLAVVAYRQPVSRSRVSAIRGVGVDAVVRTLLGRGLIEELGTDPSSGAVLYGTTDEFLDLLGLTALSELPDLSEHLPDLESFLTDEDMTSI